MVDVYKRDIDPRRYNVPFLLYPFVSLYTTRGCPAQCTFCLWPQTLSGHPWRKRSSDAVAAEMAKAKEYWPWVKEFFFDDDTFNIQKARTIELCSKLKPLNLTWSCTSRVTTDYETLKAMKEAGCRLLIVGYESGDQQILKNIKKGATVERARDFTRDCKKLGLVVHGDFILGLPGETKETIRRTIDFAKELDVETIQVSLAHAYPGTELYDYAKANGFILNEGSQMVDEMGHQVAMIEYPGISRDYILEMVHRFYDEYYFRPKAIFRIVKRAAFNSTDRKRLYTEAKSFLKLRAARNRSVKETRKQQEFCTASDATGGNREHRGQVRDRRTGQRLEGWRDLSQVPHPARGGDLRIQRQCLSRPRHARLRASQQRQLDSAVDSPCGIPGSLLGIGLLILFFCSYLTALSWADLTYVLPATALSYVLMALLASLLLHENVTVAHWLGIALITAGVGFVATGPSLTTHAEVESRPAADDHRSHRLRDLP